MEGKKYAAQIWTGGAGLVVLIVLIVLFYMLTTMVTKGDNSLPLVAIGGVVVLVLLLTAVATMFSILSLTNNTQALGLPEGSIRAVIALSLIVLFAILSVFLYQNISKGTGPVAEIKQMTPADRSLFFQTHTNARDIQSVEFTVKPGTYDVSYRSSNPASEDFAKQLLVLLGTLMTAVTSFYLGAGSVTSGVKAGSDAAGASAAAPPTLSGINPPTHPWLRGARSILRSREPTSTASSKSRSRRTALRLSRPRSHRARVRLFVTLMSATATSGAWDVEVNDGGAKSASLPGALTIT